jgi:hypothetical protein
MRFAASATFLRMSSEICGLLRNACEIVFLETPYALAACYMETSLLSIHSAII